MTTVEKVIALQEVDIFSEVSTRELAYLAAIVEERSFSQGEQIYGTGDVADSMYLLLSGRVRLHRDGMEIAEMGPGEAFGTWSLFDDEPRVSAATALDEAAVLKLHKDSFIDLLSDNVEITQGVLKALVLRVRGLLGRVGGGAR